jgi:tetratricopeptide (TPR) repeat protein
MRRYSFTTDACLPLALAVALWVQATPAAAAPEELSRAEALATLHSPDAGERRRGAVGLAVKGKMEDTPALIAALRDDDEGVRAIAEEALWAVWSRSGDAQVDDLFREGVAQMSGGRLREAIETFTRIIERKPDFAEGWNKRATAYFLAGDYRRSLADCDEVIKRNPQHFGALSGYGRIYLQLDEPDKALEYLRRALAINPNLDGVEGIVEKLESFIARRRRRSI